MNKTKITITLDLRTVKCIDRLIQEEVFPSRSQVIQEAVEEKLQRIERGRLAKECARLDLAFEKAMAEEGMSISLARLGDAENTNNYSVRQD